MAIIIAFPLMVILVVLQTSLVSRFPLLQGTPDLVLIAIIAWAVQNKVQTAWQWSIIGGLMVEVASALPPGVPLIGYCLAVAMALWFRRRSWQLPVLAMLVVTFFSTLAFHALAITSLRIIGDPIPVFEALSLITLPSLLLNILLAVPAYAIMGDIARWLYPEALEV